MLEHCKTCLWYEEGTDEIYRDGDDGLIIDDPNPDKHFCEELDDKVIPKEIWERKAKCPHYVKDPLIK